MNTKLINVKSAQYGEIFIENEIQYILLSREIHESVVVFTVKNLNTDKDSQMVFHDDDEITVIIIDIEGF